VSTESVSSDNLLRVPPSRSRTSLDADGFWSLGRAYRLAMYRSGALTFGQVLAWAARAPREVPKVNDEFEFIVLHTPEVAD
jgi:hypothetical protein